MPHLMFPKGHLDVLNLRPSLPRLHYCSYRISKTDEDMTIKDWKKCMDNRRELLGTNIERSARIRDRIVSILHNGESGPILFYAILFYLREGSRSYERGVGPRYNVLLCATMC